MQPYMKTINKEMLIAEILQVDEGVVPYLLDAGMHCVGCPAAQGESLAEACELHGIDVDELVGKINDFLANNNE